MSDEHICNSGGGLWAAGWLERGERRRQLVLVIRSACCGHLCDFDKEVDMVTTIGIDPHEPIHTAVAIDEMEQVVGEFWRFRPTGIRRPAS